MWKSRARHLHPISRGIHTLTKITPSGLTFHAYGHTEGIAAILISEHNYPSRVAHELLSIVINEFLTKHPRSSWANSNPTISFPELEKYLVKYQDLNAVDRIKNVQDELDGVKATLYQTMDTLLERGEKLDDMVTKSEVLSAQSKMFYTQAKKQNSCCVVM